jgi:hypothetical protein
VKRGDGRAKVGLRSRRASAALAAAISPQPSVSMSLIFVKMFPPARTLQLPQGSKFWPQGTNDDAYKRNE